MRRNLNIVLLCMLIPGVAGAAAFRDWDYKLKITFGGYAPPGGSEVLTNFPVLVILSTNITDFSYSQFRSSLGHDLRFADASEQVPLNYEIEKWDTNGNSCVWVQVPSLGSSNDHIWAYWCGADTNQPVSSTNGATWSSSCAAVLHLGESAFPYNDSTAGRRNGTAGVAPAHSDSGAIAGGQIFNGATTKIDIPYTNALNPAVYTISCWAKVTGGDGTYRSPMTSRISIPQHGYVVYADNAGKWGYWQGNSSTWVSAIGPPVVNGSWTHVAGTYDGSTMQLTINGTLCATNVTAMLQNTNSPLRIGAGASEGAGDYWFNGLLDEVRVESVVRSSNWLWACWLNQGSNNAFNSYGEVALRPAGTVIMLK